MPVPLLDLSKYLIIGIMWLIFLRVIRAVWVEVRTTQPARGQRRPEKKLERAHTLVNQRVESPTFMSASTAVRSPTFHLEGVSGPHKGEVIFIGQETTIGRSPDNTISLGEDNYASNRHARLLSNDGALWAEDLASTNGTLVNRKKIDVPTQLNPGDLLEVGKSSFKVVTQ